MYFIEQRQCLNNKKKIKLHLLVCIVLTAAKSRKFKRRGRGGFRRFKSRVMLVVTMTNRRYILAIDCKYNDILCEVRIVNCTRLKFIVLNWNFG